MVSPSFVVGIMGNIFSVLVYAAPVGMFKEIVKHKTTENYDVLPFVATLLCKSLWAFYGVFDKHNGLLIVTVNGIGVLSESIYVLLFLFYAPTPNKRVRIFILVGVVNIAFVGSVIGLALAVFHGSQRRTFMGFLCATVTIVMYAAPLKAMVPNAIGILSSTSQIILYMIYRNRESEKTAAVDEELGEVDTDDVVKELRPLDRVVDEGFNGGAPAKNPGVGKTISLPKPPDSSRLSKQRMMIRTLSMP
ncbi:bidirectional sugar transporter SWEET16-like [Diospyros lotus]|uniref:bidirectional sugar transporter SWEET16-like n=1 Tax=Diospyros lotus TaxID=55363 RepID=UPI0022584960|nr:bidirectional sugar transporter SWEET16-like [Diospyros lotus]